MRDTTKADAMTLLRQAWDILEASVDKSQDLCHVIDNLVDVLTHLAEVEAEGE